MGMEPRLILVDGYNVIKNTPGLAAADRVSVAAGREALLAQLAATYRPTPHQVVVVFDGDGEAQRIAALRGLARGKVIYTAHGESADDVLTRLSADAAGRGELVTLVTNDGDLRQRVTPSGTQTTGSDALASRLNPPSWDVRKRGQHRAAVKAQLDARDEDDAVRRRGGKKGNPHRAPRRSRGSRDPSL